MPYIYISKPLLTLEGLSLLRDSKLFTLEWTFQLQTNQFKAQTQTTAFIRYSHCGSLSIWTSLITSGKTPEPAQVIQTSQYQACLPCIVCSSHQNQCKSSCLWFHPLVLPLDWLWCFSMWLPWYSMCLPFGLYEYNKHFSMAVISCL